MRQTTGTRKSLSEKLVKDIKRATRKQYSSEEKIRIVLDGLRGEDSIAELCRREGISQGIYYKWSKDFMEAGKKRLAGDTARAANTDEVKDLRREARDLKEVVAEQTLELRLLKKSMIPKPVWLEVLSCDNPIVDKGLDSIVYGDSADTRRGLCVNNHDSILIEHCGWIAQLLSSGPCVGGNTNKQLQISTLGCPVDTNKVFRLPVLTCLT